MSHRLPSSSSRYLPVDLAARAGARLALDLAPLQLFASEADPWAFCIIYLPQVLHQISGGGLDLMVSIFRIARNVHL